MCCSGAGRGEGPGGRAAGPASVWLAGYRAARTRFPPRTPAADWPASTQAREQAHEHLAGLRPGQAGALGALLDWLGGQDGGSWQQRWLASGSEAAGAGWRQLPGGWLNRRPGQAAPLPSALVSALITAVCAGLVRPSLAWLVAGGCESRRACPRHVRAARPRRIRPAAGAVRRRLRRGRVEDSPHPHAAPGGGHPGRQGRHAGRHHHRGSPGAAGHRGRRPRCGQK